MRGHRTRDERRSRDVLLSVVTRPAGRPARTSARTGAGPGRHLLLLGALGAAAVLGGCAGSSGNDGASKSGPSGTLAPVQTGEVRIQALDNNYRPQTATVKAGSKVVWSNDGRNDHNIIPVGDTPFKVDIAQFKPGTSYTYEATAPGTFAYYCSLHGTADGKGMAGTLQVVP